MYTPEEYAKIKERDMAFANSIWDQILNSPDPDVRHKQHRPIMDLRHVMETIRESGGTARTIRVCGGGAKSRTWNMIKASMLKMPVYILADDSGDVPVGDCMIVGKKVGVFKSFEEASSRAIRVKEIIQPVDEWVEVYDKLYPYYVKLYQHLDQDLKELKQTVATL